MNQEKAPLSPLQEVDCKTASRFGRLLRPKGMSSRLRIKNDDRLSTYHAMSRTAGGEYLFDDVAKEALRKLIWKMAAFSGVEVLTYCIMDNHFHVLVSIPERSRWLARFAGEKGEEKFLRHLSTVYSHAFVQQLRAELLDLRAAGRDADAVSLLTRFKDRLCDISKFMKEVKERFTRWFNKHYGRRGTLWMDRFKSVLVQGPGRVCDLLDQENASLMMANYIDLNPVRAGICQDPKDYRWCGYGEAMGGSKRARRGLNRVQQMPLDNWETTTKGRASGAERYRMLLFGKAVVKVQASTEKVVRKGIEPAKVYEVRSSDGKLSRAEMLRCRIRYFSEGRVIGAKSFVKGFKSEAMRTKERAVEMGHGLFVPRRPAIRE